MTSKLSSAHYTVIACDGQGWEDLTGIGMDDPANLPDIIVLDASVQNGDGLSLCETFKQSSQMAHIPILFTHDIDAEISPARAFEAGANDVLTRPFNAEILLARLRLLIRSRTRQSAYDLTDTYVQDVTALPLMPIRTGIVAADAMQVANRFTLLKEEFDPDIALYGWSEVFAISEPDAAADLLIIHADGQNLRSALNMISDLRSRAAWQHVGIIFMAPAGTEHSGLIADALNTGADDVVISNVSDAELLARLHRQARLKRSSDTLRRRIQSGLRQAMTDPLTGLKNRRFAAEHLSEIARHAMLTRQPFAVLMLDIDHFKSVNDNFGHAVGDTVLRKVASVLHGNLRETDLLARIGGEEFLVALPAVQPEIATLTAERLRNVVEGLRFAISGAENELAVTLSIGMVFSDGLGAVETLLEQADQALYCAKAGGRNTVSIAA